MLNFSFPQAVEVAISIDSYCFIVSQGEGDMGFVTGLQNLTLTTVFGLDIDPLDEMLRKHRMIYRTHIDMDCTIFNSNSGQMLFAAGFYGVRLESLHFLTTTHHGNTCVVNHTNQIAAMTADIKLCTHFNFLRFINSFPHALRRMPEDACRQDRSQEPWFLLRYVRSYGTPRW